MIESVQPHYENKSVVLETIGSVLATSFLPDGINVLKMAFTKKVTSLGKTNREWFATTIKALDHQIESGFGEAEIQLAPIHLSVLEQIEALSPEDATAGMRLRTLATITENSIIPSADIDDLISALTDKAEELKVSGKIWIQNPLTAMLAQAEITDGLLDETNVTGLPLTTKGQGVKAVAAE